MNKGLKLARGEYIARQDADDISMPERLKKEVEFLEMHQDCAVVGTFAKIINENPVIKIITFGKIPPVTFIKFLIRIRFSNRINKILKDFQNGRINFKDTKLKLKMLLIGDS